MSETLYGATSLHRHLKDYINRLKCLPEIYSDGRWFDTPACKEILEGELLRLARSTSLSNFDLEVEIENGQLVASVSASLLQKEDRVTVVIRDPIPHKHDTLSVAELAQQLERYIARGEGDYLVAHPGVSGDVFVTRTYTEEEEIDDCVWRTLILTDVDETVLAKRERHHISAAEYPTVRDAAHLANVEAERRIEAQNAADARAEAAKLRKTIIDLEQKVAHGGFLLDEVNRHLVRAEEQLGTTLEDLRAVEKDRDTVGQENDVLRDSLEESENSVAALRSANEQTALDAAELQCAVAELQDSLRDCRASAQTYLQTIALLRDRLLRNESPVLVDQVLLSGLHSWFGPEGADAALGVTLTPAPMEDAVHLRKGRQDEALCGQGGVVTVGHLFAKKVTCVECLKKLS